MKKLLLILLILILLASFVSALSTNNESLLFYYIMNETNGDLIDNKINSKPNYILVENDSGIPDYERPPVVNWSVKSIGFDNAFIFFNDTPLLNNIFNQPFADGFTLGASFNPNGTAAEGIVSWTNDAGLSGFVMLILTAGGICCGDISASRVCIEITSFRNYTVVCTYEPGTVSMYLKNDTNGNPYFVGSTSLTVSSTSEALRIGHWSPGQGAFFDGTISDVWMLNLTMNQNDIFDVMSNGIEILEELDIMPPINSSWNVTSNNVVEDENSSTWNFGGTINITTDLLSFTVTTNENSNGSCRLEVEQNYTEMIANNSNFKFATTETTSHAYTISETITEGNHCLYCSFIDESGNEPKGANSSSGCLNFTRLPIVNLSIILNPNLAGLAYNVNWSLARNQLNFSNANTSVGNYSWNFTDKGLTTYPIVVWLYNITNTGEANFTVNLKISRNESYFNWSFNGTKMTTTAVDLFNLTVNESRLINFTLDLINILQIYVNWSVTEDRANWTFTPTFNSTDV